MTLICLDLEGVLVPEIWINVAEKTGIDELKLTTRDISDYDKLMKHRLKILKEKNIKFRLIKDVIASLKPLPHAENFLRLLRERFQVVILSDTFYQFAEPLMKLLGYPTLLCHNLVINENGYIDDYKIRINDAKRVSIIKFKEMNFKVIASGDSYNDISMLKEADKGILYRPPQNVINEYPEFPVAEDYDKLWDNIIEAEKNI